MATRSERATSFGRIASDYDRWRPGPAPEVADWLLPADAQVVVDLGAGTGAMTRLLVERDLQQVYAVEPDARMRHVLAARSPRAVALDGRGDHIPLEDSTADAIVCCSAWHWMDVEPTLREIARVLRPGGVLGVAWSGANRSGSLLRDLLGRPPGADSLHNAVPEAERAAREARHRLELPAGVPFAAPEHREITWSRRMGIDELVGLAGTYSTVIVLPQNTRLELLDSVRARLESRPEFAAAGTVEVPFRANCWRSRRT